MKYGGLKMFNNANYYQPYNNLQAIAGYRVQPVARIEEANTIFPDLQGNPLFFFDQSRNEFYVKQRNVQTAEVQMFKYTLAKEPLSVAKTQESINSYDEQISEIKSELERLASVINARARKGTKDDE